MGTDGFITELRKLGYETLDRDGGLIVFDYVVEVGPLTGEAVKIAVQVPPDWPATPPGGPIVSPRLLPISSDASAGHPYGAVHEAPQLGPDWEYWSRPFPAWAQTERSVGAYMCHIRHLFDMLPDELQRDADD